MPENADDESESSDIETGISFTGDGWSQHELGTDEGAGVWLRGLASYTNPDGSVTVVVAGSQGNMFMATVPAPTAPVQVIPTFTPVSRTGTLGTIPAFKWFDSVSFGGAQSGTLGFATGYHGLLLETTDGGQSWSDLTNPTPSAALRADIASVGISPIAAVYGDGTTPVLVATGLAPGAKFYPAVHYGTIDSDGTITWNASTLNYDNGTTAEPLDHTYYRRVLQALYLSDKLVLASGEATKTTSQSNTYPLMLSTDGGESFSTIPTFPQSETPITQLHELIADPEHQGIVWGAGPGGTILRIDLSSYFGLGPDTVEFSQTQLPSTDSVYGLAISPNDDAMVAVTRSGHVYWTTDPTGVGSVDPASLQWNLASPQLSIGEVWSAEFITDTDVVVVGEADTPTVNGDTVNASGGTDMVWFSNDAGLDWTPINLDTQWTTQQTALTGVINAFTSSYGTNHLTNAQGEIPTSQDTLLLSGATLEVTSPAAVATPAMILLPPGSTLHSPAMTVDTLGNDLTLKSVLSGSGELIKTGAGTLTLNPTTLYNPDGAPRHVYRANFLSGGIEIDGGVISIDFDAELGVPNANKPGHSSPEVIYPSTGTYALTLNGGTLQAGRDITLQTTYDLGGLTRPVALGGSGGSFDPNGFTMTLPGPVSGAGGLSESGPGTLVLDAINSFSGGVTVAAGTLDLPLSGALPAVAALTVEASGRVLIDGSEQTASAIAGSGEIALNGGTLVVNQTALGADIEFSGESGQLLFETSDPSVLIGGLRSPIFGFNSAAEIDLAGLAYNSGDVPQYAGGTLTIDNSSSALAVLHFDPTGSYDFMLSPGKDDSVAVTDLACFAEGTLIATRHGDVPVERLQTGALVITASGSELPVSWLGYREVACRRDPRPELVWPVCIRAHSFGKDLPKRDLLLSPDHAVFVANVLIPIKYLINDTSIVQIVMDRVTYYHIELPQHNVLLAEGLGAESYLDTRDRSNFSNGGAAIRLFPDLSARAPDAAWAWEAYGYAPLVVSGPIVEAVRLQLERSSRKLKSRKRRAALRKSRVISQRATERTTLGRPRVCVRHDRA